MVVPKEGVADVNDTGEWHKLKAEGNKLFADGNHLKAAARYTAAIKSFNGSDEDLAVIHRCVLESSNRCAALIKIAKLQKALQDADKCIELRPKWEKGYFRKGCTLEAMTDFSSALDAFQLGMKCAPESSELGSKVQRLGNLLKKQKQKKAQKAG